MAQTIVRIQSKLLKEYYKYFSKYSNGQMPEKKVAWVTAFTPIEILEALDIAYYYPESYSAVIAASGKEQELLSTSETNYLSRDCCSYSCCFNGCLDLNDGPRGIPPKPDILIATNNQCNTLPNWWNVLSVKYNIPLIIIDYPGEKVDRSVSYDYVKKQHELLIRELEKLSGNLLSEEKLSLLLDNSSNSIEEWRKVLSFIHTKGVSISSIFDDMNFLIMMRCKSDTSEMYSMMAEAISQKDDISDDRIPIFWLGYPLWYHQNRYLYDLLTDCRVTGANYPTWWNLDYSGNNPFERLFSAYNFTFLNLSQSSRDELLANEIKSSGAKFAIVLHNKSCKCDFVSAQNIDIPQVEVEIDMIDRNFLNLEKARIQIELMKKTLCTTLA